MARTKAEARKEVEAQGTNGKGTKKADSKKTKGTTKAKKESSSVSANSSQGMKVEDIAAKEVRYYQANTKLQIPKVSFQRMVRDIVKKLGPSFRFEVQALLALQEAAEEFLTGVYEDASLCSLHGRRVTLMPRDLHLSRRIRSGGESDGTSREKFSSSSSSSSAAPAATTGDAATAAEASTTKATVAEGVPAKGGESTSDAVCTDTQADFFVTPGATS
eukprot:TRINITY_DN116618_c0_g1_i1.p1 TRINITY_DN116618_c0_g1~~TRINITY_DN116618_c0_g1_i1.p1  ORF type:complete len:218 (+),score=52.64 TRINITY_DN116618_c0_g1_i1:76-729(+)